MKEYLKNELKHLPMIVIVSIIFCGINTLANNHLFNSKDVDYDNSNTHIESTNVGDAIDELFDAANNFTTYDTRLQGVESKVGTGTLNTTAQNLIGGVNELNSNFNHYSIVPIVVDQGVTGVTIDENTNYSCKIGRFVQISFILSLVNDEPTQKHIASNLPLPACNGRGTSSSTIIDIVAKNGSRIRIKQNGDMFIDNGKAGQTMYTGFYIEEIGG